MNHPHIQRIVPNIYTDNVEGCKGFYTDFLGMKLVMDMGWIVTFASRHNPTAQITVLQYDKPSKPNNDTVFLSVEVEDVDALYTQAQACGYQVVYPLTNEPWGVRRFFVRDPSGATLNILEHG